MTWEQLSRMSYPGFGWLSWADDGFGNLLEHCGSWYHDHPEASTPEGMIRCNSGAARAFVFDNWHQLV